MAEKKTKEQIEADILKEATAAAAKERKEEKVPLGTPPKEEKKAPQAASRMPQAEKPTTKEKLAAAEGGKGGVMKQALDTVKKLKDEKKGEGEKKERKIKFERVYTVPIAKPVSRTRKTRTAMRTLRAFVVKHSKAKDVKIDQEVNHFVWARSYQKPPNKVRVSVSVDEEGLATVSLKK